MPNQLLRGLIFIILVFLVTSDLKEIISALTASSSITSAFLQRPAPSSHQRSKRHVSSTTSQKNAPSAEAEDREDGPYPTGGSSIPSTMKFESVDDTGDSEHSSSDVNDNDSLDPLKKLNIRGQNAYAKRKVIKLNGKLMNV